MSDEPTRARYPDEEGYVERDGVWVSWERYGEGELMDGSGCGRHGRRPVKVNLELRAFAESRRKREPVLADEGRAHA